MSRASITTDNVEIPSSGVDGSNADLYARDLPLLLASRLGTLDAKPQSSGSVEPADIEHKTPDTLPKIADGQPGRGSPEPPHSPPFTKPTSWHAIDAATAERRANMQTNPEPAEQDKAAQELRALKRCLELRKSISRTAFANLGGRGPLAIPKSWAISEAPLQRLVRDPFLFEEYLTCEQNCLEMIKARKRNLRFHISSSPQLLILSRFRNEMKYLTLIAKEREDLRASRLLVDLLLGVFRHVTEMLLVDIMEGDVTREEPLSALCHRLLTHSTHPDEDGELIIAVQNIEDMEREHLPWRYKALDCSLATSPTSSMERPSPVVPRDSPPAVEICLSPQSISPPPPTKSSPVKGSRRLRVRFEENLSTQGSFSWRQPRKSQPTSSSSSRELGDRPLSQREPPRAVSTEGRSHRRSKAIWNLTHPIVMMATGPGYSYNQSQPPQSALSKGKQPVARTQFDPPWNGAVTPAPATTWALSGPVHTSFSTNSFTQFTQPVDPRLVPTMPATPYPQKASLVHTRLKRKASGELIPPNDHVMKCARLPSIRPYDREAQYVSVEAEDADTEMSDSRSSMVERPPFRTWTVFPGAYKRREEDLEPPGAIDFEEEYKSALAATLKRRAKDQIRQGVQDPAADWTKQL